MRYILRVKPGVTLQEPITDVVSSNFPQARVMDLSGNIMVLAEFPEELSSEERESSEFLITEEKTTPLPDSRPSISDRPADH